MHARWPPLTLTPQGGSRPPRPPSAASPHAHLHGNLGASDRPASASSQFFLSEASQLQQHQHLGHQVSSGVCSPTFRLRLHQVKRVVFGAAAHSLTPTDTMSQHYPCDLMPVSTAAASHNAHPPLSLTKQHAHASGPGHAAHPTSASSLLGDGSMAEDEMEIESSNLSSDQLLFNGNIGSMTPTTMVRVFWPWMLLDGQGRSYLEFSAALVLVNMHIDSLIGIVEDRLPRTRRPHAPTHTCDCLCLLCLLLHDTQGRFLFDSTTPRHSHASSSAAMEQSTPPTVAQPPTHVMQASHT